MLYSNTHSLYTQTQQWTPGTFAAIAGSKSPPELESITMSAQTTTVAHLATPRAGLHGHMKLSTRLDYTIQLYGNSLTRTTGKAFHEASIIQEPTSSDKETRVFNDLSISSSSNRASGFQYSNYFTTSYLRTSVLQYITYPSPFLPTPSRVSDGPPPQSLPLLTLPSPISNWDSLVTPCSTAPVLLSRLTVAVHYASSHDDPPCTSPVEPEKLSLVNGFMEIKNHYAMITEVLHIGMANSCGALLVSYYRSMQLSECGG